MGKSVRLKFYADPPLVKLVILGDFLWLQHYHPDLNVRTMPEYVLKYNPNDHGLYTFYYHYFVQRWSSCHVGDYDFDRDELVYRDSQGRLERRVSFGPKVETHSDTLPGFTDGLSMSAPSSRSLF
jgi:hypothetical protein